MPKRPNILFLSDSPAIYPKGRRYCRKRAWWFLPCVGKVDFRFKREILP